MNREELIWDVKIILEAANITDESRFDDDYIGYKLDQKRSKEIRDTFKRNPIIEPVWLQDHGLTEFTPVNKAEDRSVSICNCTLSKAVLPAIVSLNDPMTNQHDLGVYRIFSACNTREYHFMNLNKLSQIDPDSIYSKFSYYTPIGNSYYLTPNTRYARPILILESPLSGYVLDNTYKQSGALEANTTYEVASGNITYDGDGITYYKGDTFTTGSVSTFTGNGKVFLYLQKRSMTNSDPYPMSQTMADVVLMKLFTQDYAIEAQRITDIKNNSQDQFKVIDARQ